MTRKIDIERIELNGIQIPSNETLHILADELETLEKVKKFIKNNNDTIRHMRIFFNHDAVECYRSARISLRLMNNYQAQCKLTGIDFPALWYSIAVITYFEPLMGYFECPNRSDLIKDIVKHENTFKKTGIYINASKYFDDKDNLKRFTQFSLARDLFNQCSLLAYELSKNDSQMKDLLIQNDEIKKEWIKKGDRVDPHRVCRFCLSVFNVRTSPDKWKSCGSPKCKKAYSAVTSRKSSNQPHALNKKTASQWMKIDNIYRWCVSTCGKRRLVNAEQICKKCCDKPE